MDNLEKLLSDKMVKQQELEAIEAKIRGQSLGQVKESLNQSLRYAQAIEGEDRSDDDVKSVYAECKTVMKDLVKSIYGDEYKISKSAALAGKGNEINVGFEWGDMVKSMRENGATTKEDAIGRKDIERILFDGDEKKKLLPSKWNNTKERNKYLISTGGNRRDTKYYIGDDKS